MKKILKRITILMVMLSLVVPYSAFAVESDNDYEHANIDIFFSHDMHSHLEKFPKIDTLMEDAVYENPSTYLLDAGDFSMGTPFQTIFKSEASELRMMGNVGYDATTLGNHEFDYRSSGLTEMLKKAKKEETKAKEEEWFLYGENTDETSLPKLVIANIDWDKTLADKDKKEDGEALKKALKKYGAKDYTVIEKEGSKIAVFGIFGNESASFAPESGTYFLDPVETAQKVVDKIKKKEKVDLIVCLSHSGTNQEDSSQSEDEILAKKVDGIDLIISGHSHTELKEPIIENNTVIASCGQYNNRLGSISFKYEDGKYEMDNYNLIKLNDDIFDNAETEYQVEEFKAIVNNKYFSKYGYNWDDVLANNKVNFTDIDQFGLKAGEDTLGNLISDSYIYGVKNAEGSKYETVNVSIAPAGVIRGSFNKGPITTADAFNALSLGTGKDGKAGYPLVSIYLTGKELRAVAEVDATVSEMMQPARLYMSGLNYTFNPNRLILDRAYNVTVRDDNGKMVELDSGKLYRVVGDLYSCQMLGTVNDKSHGLLSVTPKDKDGNEITNFEDQIIYNSKGQELKEWHALASYIDSLGGNKISEKYSKVEGRRTVVDSKNIWEIIKDPNRVFIMLACIIILAIALLALIIVLIIRLIRRIAYGKGYSRKKYPKMKKEKNIFSNKRRRRRF